MTETSPPSLSAEELKFRYYDARLGVWKVVLGTMVIGLAGIIFPFAMQSYNSYFENQRKATELNYSQQAAHQQYIKDFFSTAINQDIELRIRFADYFANLSGPPQAPLWTRYRDSLKALRDEKRKRINELEKRLVDFKKLPPEQIDNAEFDLVNRELIWANAEIGYVPSERSAIVTSPENSTAAKRARLYQETTDLVQRLANRNGPLTGQFDDLARFWNLYRRDLIGVESPAFARKMIAIGKELQKLTTSNANSSPELQQLAVELLAISREELGDLAQVEGQQQQQQQ